MLVLKIQTKEGDFSCGPVVKNPLCNAGCLIRELIFHILQQRACAPYLEFVPCNGRPCLMHQRGHVPQLKPEYLKNSKKKEARKLTVSHFIFDTLFHSQFPQGKL